MKISCPRCHANGTIPDHEIPDSGRFVSCPHCKEGFTVTRPLTGADAYRVDTCPSCGFSTFGDELFSTCPKCSIAIKTFNERQREEQLQKHNQELLARKFNNNEISAPPVEVSATPVADFIENLHPVNLISWGAAGVALIILSLGLWGLVEYDSVKIKAQLLEERDEQVSGIYVFLHYGLIHWVKILYGTAAVGVALQFMKRYKNGLRSMSVLLWVTIALVPLLYIIGFVNWVLAPIPHTISGYLVELLNIFVVSSLIGGPLFYLERYLHQRTIISVVNR